MAEVSGSRTRAHAVLGDVRRHNARARDALRVSRRLQGAPERERAQSTRLVLGTVGARGLLDAVIDAHAKRPGRIEPQVRDALRLAVYELLFLSTPAAVAVSQGVGLVRRMRPRAAGMANAVLHRVADVDVPACAQALQRAYEGVASDDDLALVSGYPSWLLGRVRQDRGERAVHGMALSAREPAPVFVAANLALHGLPETGELLRDAGLDPRALDEPAAFELKSPAGLSSSGLVEATDVMVADLSAQRVVSRCGVEPGMRVLEVGQGRGTKSLLLQNAAIAGGGHAHITGVDQVAYKVRIARERMVRADVADYVGCWEYDACRLADDDVPDELAGSFDLVLVDAPCSGTGTIRRHPEIAWDLTPQDVSSLAELQAKMLSAAIKRVRPGGTLVYATCSLLREENEGVVERLGLDGTAFQTLPAPNAPDGHFCMRTTVR